MHLANLVELLERDLGSNAATRSRIADQLAELVAERAAAAPGADGRAPRPSGETGRRRKRR
ncbi:MAG: hypothetical protein K1X88_19110 [Nannocystaceae bacterium]|nr:hypothetical protein [Nannocystaceae bacterium]